MASRNRCPISHDWPSNSPTGGRRGLAQHPAVNTAGAQSNVRISSRRFRAMRPDFKSKIENPKSKISFQHSPLLVVVMHQHLVIELIHFGLDASDVGRQI